MTREEAMQILRTSIVPTMNWQEIHEALNMAIKALQTDVVRCNDCEHRPIKEDADGDDYGFNIIEPTYGDERCPCLVEDGWYSWMPKDDFYCGYGERKSEG